MALHPPSDERRMFQSQALHQGRNHLQALPLHPLNYTTAWSHSRVRLRNFGAEDCSSLHLQMLDLLDLMEGLSLDQILFLSELILLGMVVHRVPARGINPSLNIQYLSPQLSNNLLPLGSSQPKPMTSKHNGPDDVALKLLFALLE